MPTVLRFKGFTVTIYVADHEPPHVHIRKGGLVAKITLADVPKLEEADRDLKAPEIRQMLKIVYANRAYLLAKWQEIHGSKS